MPSTAGGPKDQVVGELDVVAEEAERAVVCLALQACRIELHSNGTDLLRQHAALARVVRVADGVVVVWVGVVGQVCGAREWLVVGALGCSCWSTTMTTTVSKCRSCQNKNNEYS